MAAIPFIKEKSYCLLVGVGKREEDSEAMAISAEDARHLKLALVNFNVFSEKKITSLINEEAKRSTVLDQLDSLAVRTKDEAADLVIIYFSGHGCEINEKYYLICRDTKRSDIANTAIAGSLFVEKLKAIRCDKMLVLLDCCHAEGVTNPDVDIPFDEHLLLEQQNRVILTACHKSQVSYLSSPVSIFTYALIEALGGKFLIGEDDKEVNVFSLAMDVRERVVALSEQVLKPDKIQKPQLNVLEKNGTSNFVIARYPKGGPREITLFKKDFSSLKSYEGKDLNMNVEKKKDKGYRDQFNWMVMNNSIRDIRDGNYIVQGVQGPVNFYAGISPEELKNVSRDISTSIRTEFQAMLKSKEDDDSKALLQKVEQNESTKNEEKKMLKEQLTLLLKKKNHFVIERISTADAGQKWSIDNEINNINKQIEEINEALKLS